MHLPDNANLQDIGCTRRICTGPVVKKPCNVENKQFLPPDNMKKEAKSFLQEFYREQGLKGFQQRLSEVFNDIDSQGTYVHTKEELIFGAKTAWRNAPRCILRIQWNSLEVFDRRDCVTNEQMYEACVEHLNFATNNGAMRSTISVFPPKQKNGDGPRIYGDQLIRFAAYTNNDGTILGDKPNLLLTNFAIELGWKAPEPKTAFDVLPIILQADSENGVLAKEYPKESVLLVPITHPTYTEVFEKYQLLWYAVPALSSMVLEVGGIEYTCCPFNGCYTTPEIAMRNLCDPFRYDLQAKLGKDIGLNIDSHQSLWQEKTLTIFNEAVLHSFNKAKVTMLDQYSAAAGFMVHMRKETRVRGFIASDWIWLVPPSGGVSTEIFHQEMLNFFIKPSYTNRRDTLKELIERSSFGKQNPQLEIKGNIFIKAAASLNINQCCDGKYNYSSCQEHLSQATASIQSDEVGHNMHLQLKRRSEDKLSNLQRPPPLRIQLYYASETGTAEGFYEQIHSSLQTLLEKSGTLDDLEIEDIIKAQDLREQERKIILIVTSTFGNGGSPWNGAKFQKIMEEFQEKDKYNLNHVNFALFGLGNSDYEQFGQFPTAIQTFFKELGMKELEELVIADEKTGLKKPFVKWKESILYKIFNILGNEFEITNSNDDDDDDDDKEKWIIQELLPQKESSYTDKLSHQKQLCTFQSQYGSDSMKILTFVIPDGGLRSCLPGDYVAITPKNCQEFTDFCYQYFQIGNPKQTIQLKGDNVPLPLKGQFSYQELFESILDLHCPPNKQLIRLLLDPQTSADILANYYDWIETEYPTSKSVLENSLKQGIQRIELATFLQLASIMKPRCYQISHFGDRAAQILVSTTVIGKNRLGTCTNYLWNLKDADQVQYTFRSANKFRLQNYHTQMNIIMIANGSGLSPFLAFLQRIHCEKQKQLDCGGDGGGGKITLLYGCRRKSDLIAESVINEYICQKTLNQYLVAFSQEEHERHSYVQDKLKENWNEIITADLTLSNTMIFVCGSKAMGHEVSKLFENEGLVVLKDLY